MSEKQTMTEMPPTQDRRPYDDEDPDGYLEGNNDWAENNNEAVEWLADNHAAIRLALKSARELEAENERLRKGFYQQVVDADLVEIEHFLQDRRLPGRTLFIPADADHLANTTNHMIRELQALRGLKPEAPPFPPDGFGLPRYGLRWNGPATPLAVPFEDGYWTPWHLADKINADRAACWAEFKALIKSSGETEKYLREKLAEREALLRDLLTDDIAPRVAARIEAFLSATAQPDDRVMNDE